MNLVALLLGLALERLLTNLLHLRELRWFDRYFDWTLQSLNRFSGLAAAVLAAVYSIVPVLPVLGVGLAFGERLYGIPYVLFAALVLIFSIGPRDLGEEVEEYCQAVTDGDGDRATRVAKELLEHDVPETLLARDRAMEEAIFVQANNRLFGVIFWFMLLGPAGAWLFRSVDLMRRRAMFEAGRTSSETGERPTYVVAVRSVHGVLAWLPARLLALGYALAGGFEEALSNWRAYYQHAADRFFDVSDDIVARVGKGAMSTLDTESDTPAEIQLARSALRLVRRTLFVWVTGISLMTLFGWAI